MGEGNRPPIEDVERFLCQHHGASIGGLAPVGGGYWSSAYTYTCGTDDLVLRLANDTEGFEMDRVAWGFQRPDLPIPEVLAIGAAFDGAFAISRRSFGRFLEDVGPDERVGRLLDGLLGALRQVPAGDRVDWFCRESPVATTWRRWLERAMVDDPTQTVSGWRERLAADRELDRLFTTTVERIEELLPQCPERRDLVHGDLLHQNVLVADDASRVNAVFSWKCSVLGDFLYDVAWCTFWGPWHPGIAAADPWSRTLDTDLDTDSLAAGALRHHCYELHIGLQHLAWQAWTGNRAELRAVADRTSAVMEVGPLPQG